MVFVRAIVNESRWLLGRALTVARKAGAIRPTCGRVDWGDVTTLCVFFRSAAGVTMLTIPGSSTFFRLFKRTGPGSTSTR